jgi:hypothetical protein
MQRHLTIEDIFPEVSRLSVEDLLWRDCFTVPEFQRPYSWKEQQVEQFWEDIYQSYEKGDPLFLGVMVFQRQKEDPQALQVIDGHQRICTIFATLLAIRGSIRREDSEQLDQYIWKFDIGDQEGRPRLSLTNLDDQQVLELLLEGRENRIRENRLSKAYAFLQNKMQMLQRNGVDLLHFCRFLLSQVFIVKILVGEKGDPYSTFEVLNARGLELTCWDLVKNRLLALANKLGTTEERSTRKLINRIEHYEDYPVDSEFLTKFLRHYWLSWKTRVSKPQLYKAIFEHLEQSGWVCKYCSYVHKGKPPERCPSCNNKRSFYQSSGPRPSTFTREIFTELKNYINLIAPGDDTTEARDLKDLVACGFEQGRPLLMAVKRCGKKEDFNQALKIVSTLHIRYHVCELNPNELERFFSESAIAFRRRNKGIKDIMREASKRIPKDELFIDKLTKEEFSESVAKYLLRKVEESKRNPEALRERPIGTELDLEHIMPRKRSNEWPNHDPQLVKKLGNLTLVGRGYNRRVRNRGFERKLKEFRRSELIITRELTRFSSWGRKEIEERGRKLARAIAKIFRI